MMYRVDVYVTIYKVKGTTTKSIAIEVYSIGNSRINIECGSLPIEFRHRIVVVLHCLANGVVDYVHITYHGRQLSEEGAISSHGYRTEQA
jgi:hypothetical protein